MNGDLVKVETQREDLFIQDLLLRFVGDVDVILFPGSGGMFACSFVRSFRCVLLFYLWPSSTVLFGGMSAFSNLKPCHIRAASSKRFHSVKKMQIAEVRAVQSPATLSVRCVRVGCALCNLLKHHAAAFIMNMLKINAAAWRLHSMLDSALWVSCGNAVWS